VKTKVVRYNERGIRNGIDRRIWACLAIMVWVFTAVEIANGEEGKMNSEASLPAETVGWAWDGKETKYDSKTLYSYMNGAAELYLAYGFQGLRVRRFEKSSQPSITVELYEMASSEDAYGLFSYERQDEAAGIGQGSEYGGGLLRFWKGRYIVGVYSDGEGAEVESATLAMGRATADLIRETGRTPELVDLVPGKEFGLVDRSTRFLRSHILLNQRFFVARENILNLNSRTGAVLAQYNQDKTKTHLLLVQYPGIKDAQDAYKSFMNVYLPDAKGKDLLKTEDQKWTLARQRGETVVIVFGAPTATTAEALYKATENNLAERHKRESTK
jgi:hypothetical protein